MIPRLQQLREPSYRDQRFVESLYDPIAFDRLLRIAEAGWLRKTPDYTGIDTELDHPEAKLIEQLGIGGLRAALELEMDITQYNPRLPLDEGTEDELVIHPLRRPDYYTGPMNREISNKTDRFGARLIHEAYDVLGADADAYAERFKNADSDVEQAQVISWLAHRLSRMERRNRGLAREDEDAADAYHPLRFSPKALGRFPEHRLAPTCLGLALIGAGFFERAGATYMHAGVMQTEGQWEVIECAILTDTVLGDEMAEKFGVTIPDNVAERLEAKVLQAINAVSEYRGTHSALMVRLKSGRWCQVDPNYNASVILPSLVDAEGNEKSVLQEKVDRIYDTLTEFRQLAPGLELSEMFMAETLQGFLRRTLRAMEVGPDYRQKVTDLLESAPDESTIEHFREFFTGMFRDAANSNDDLKGWVKDTGLLDFIMVQNGRYELPTLDEDFREVFRQFVQWNMPIDEWRERCATDPEFKRNRVEDLMRVPLLLALRYAYSLQGRERDPSVHMMLEFGLPASNFGRAALNNIAIYLGDELSVHHWVSQWASQNAITDRLPHANRSHAQWATLANGVLEIESSHLRYTPLCGKITEFLKESGERATQPEGGQ